MHTTPSFLWTIFMALLAGLIVIGGLVPLPFSFAPAMMGVFFLLIVKLKTKAWPAADWPLYAWLLALFALTVTSSLWSINPTETLERSLKVFAVLLCSLPLIDLARRIPAETLQRWQLLIPVATLFAGCYPLIELNLDFPLQKFFGIAPPDNVSWGSILNKNVSIFIMLLAPALLICHRAGAYTLSILLLIMATALILTTDSQAAQLGLIVLPLAWCSLFILPGTGIPVTFGLVGFLILLMPWFSPLAFDVFAADMNQTDSLAAQASVSKRLENWDFISRKIMDNPWTGFGMDATRSINDFQSEKLYFPTNTIMHPHNLALQLWIEFGILGVGLMLGFLGFLLRRLLRLNSPQRRIPFTVFCVVLSFLMISWSIWASWLLGFIIFLAAITILALRTSSARATS